MTAELQNQVRAKLALAREALQETDRALSYKQDNLALINLDEASGYAKEAHDLLRDELRDPRRAGV